MDTSGATSVLPAPTIVFAPPVVLLAAPVLAVEPLDAVVDELLELDPHAASPKMAATATATPLMLRLRLNFFSLTLLVPRSLGASRREGVNHL